MADLALLVNHTLPLPLLYLALHLNQALLLHFTLFERPTLKLLSACFMKPAIKICLFSETGKAFACFMKYAISLLDS
jgi:hypothetical protein